MLRISSAEYRDRLERLRGGIRSAGLDVFVVSSFDSIYYLTGAGFEPLERPFFLLIHPDADRLPVLVVPRLDLEHMRQNAHGVAAEDVHAYWESPAPAGRRWLDRLGELLGGARQVGVEPTLPLAVAELLREYSPRTLPLVERLRVLKSATEIGMIRRAAGYADFAVERLLAASYFGASVAEGFAETRTVSSRIIREVDGWEPLTTRVVMATWAAPHSAMPHSIPHLGHRLGRGPHVALALTRVNGYSAESERTYFTAPPTAEMRRMFGAMMRARQIALGLVRAGVACAEIDAAVSGFLQHEYPDYQTEEGRLHRTGHGIGLGTHEAPWLAAGSRDVLAPNMVVSVEPGIYVPGLGGVRHSDTVAVTDGGCELLTRLPTSLDELLVLRRKPARRLKGWLVRRALRVSTDRRGEG